MSEKQAKIAFGLQILGGLFVIGAVLIAEGKSFKLPSMIVGGTGLVLFGVGWVMNKMSEPLE